ncbi:four helix bundle protein [Fodinibius halophilus]|nr:four helix bundle protein [Fodinibius halophilus]
MDYEKWIKKVPSELKHDSVWTLQVYRISLYLSEFTWEDIRPIIDGRLYSLSDQLYRSVGSISANITEGYSRRSYKEQARFYEIALGSTRESKDWYFKSRHILGDKIVNHRIKILTKITKLLLTMIKERRSSHDAREPNVDYTINDINPFISDIPIPKSNNVRP